MWKAYLAGYIKHNRTFGLSVRIAAFIAALLLSLLCGMFYNMWKYEVERIRQEEGGWHSRIAGEISEADLERIQRFAHVREAAFARDGAGVQKNAVNISFDDMRTVLKNTPKIAEMLGISSENVTYHHALLAMYMIRDPQDPAPRLIFPLFLLITGLASFSLIVIIHNAFAVSMDARLHQFGIFSSIGATPRQIRVCLLQEAAVLCALPTAAGTLLGILAGMGLLELTNRMLGADIPGRHRAVFGYHPLVLLFTLLAAAVTVWISAWIPARRLSRMTPLEAIRNTGELQLKKKKRSRLLFWLFGMEGKLAGSALKAQKKALRTASLSLAAAFLAFTMTQCFFTLTAISTRETYFERYLNVWDVMVTVKDMRIEAFADTEAVRELPGVRSAVVYQKAAAKRIVSEEEISEKMRAFGGFDAASEKQAQKVDGGWLVSAPLVILDDAAFAAYCEQIGAAPRLDGAVILNRIRNMTNPDFRHPQYVPYIKEGKTSVLRRAKDTQISAEIPVTAYTDQVPLLREEYATLDHCELVHILPVSLWKKIGEQIGGAQEDLYIRLLGKEHADPEEIDALQKEADRLLGAHYMAESENRIREKALNDRQIMGMLAVFSGFCVLLAVIGVGNVFSNALGFVRQRKREVARLLSVGLTPGQIRKMFCIEALVIAGRPVLFTLPVTALAVWYLLKSSYMEPAVFLAEAPYIPVLLFLLAALSAVFLAYYLGWRGVKKISPAETLKDDTLL